MAGKFDIHRLNGYITLHCGCGAKFRKKVNDGMRFSCPDCGAKYYVVIGISIYKYESETDIKLINFAYERGDSDA